jgi:hypothetical protein
MPFYGADINQLKTLSTKFAKGAEVLDTKVRELDSMINSNHHWQGQDAKRFTNEWQTTLRPLLHATSLGLQNASKSAVKNAGEQASASTDGSRAMGTGDHGGDGDGDGKPNKPTPQEILDKYQVSDGKMTKWPPNGSPLLLFTDQKDITAIEAGMLGRLDPFELKAFKDISDDALDTAYKRYYGLDGNDSHLDAFRHAYWNALMVKEFGAEWAEDYATAHEQLPGNPGPREAMDLYNNQVGRDIALANPDASAEELADLIEEAVKNGDTVVLGQDMLPHPSDEIPEGQTGNADKQPPVPGHKPDFNNPTAS